MIPARPIKSVPPPRKPAAIQLNRMFESREQIDKFLAEEFKDRESVEIVKVWKVEMLAASVIIGKKKGKK